MADRKVIDFGAEQRRQVKLLAMEIVEHAIREARSRGLPLADLAKQMLEEAAQLGWGDERIDALEYLTCHCAEATAWSLAVGADENDYVRQDPTLLLVESTRKRVVFEGARDRAWTEDFQNSKLRLITTHRLEIDLDQPN